MEPSCLKYKVPVIQSKTGALDLDLTHNNGVSKLDNASTLLIASFSMSKKTSKKNTICLREYKQKVGLWVAF